MYFIIIQGKEKAINVSTVQSLKNVQGKGTEIIWFSVHPLPSIEGPNKNPTKTPLEG